VWAAAAAAGRPAPSEAQGLQAQCSARMAPAPPRQTRAEKRGGGDPISASVGPYTRQGCSAERPTGAHARAPHQPARARAQPSAECGRVTIQASFPGYPPRKTPPPRAPTSTVSVGTDGAHVREHALHHHSGGAGTGWRPTARQATPFPDQHPPERTPTAACWRACARANEQGAGRARYTVKQSKTLKHFQHRGAGLRHSHTRLFLPFRSP